MPTAGGGDSLLNLHHLPSSAAGFSCDPELQGRNLSALHSTGLGAVWGSFSHTSFPDVALCMKLSCVMANGPRLQFHKQMSEWRGRPAKEGCGASGETLVLCVAMDWTLKQAQ